MEDNHPIWGIDFGAKLSGTTVIASFNNMVVGIRQSPRGKDSGKWLTNEFDETPLKPRLIGIDAPLSLPAGYYKGEDLHYRMADRQLKAMSPMFIGGLTARAIEWTRSIKSNFIEVYPSGLADTWFSKGRQERKKAFQDFYINFFLPKWFDLTGCDYKGPSPDNLHQLDALLALFTTLKYEKGKAESYGTEEEGLIWI